MAIIKKQTNFYWFDTDIYVKIGGILIKELGKNEEWIKLYSVESQVDFYTNETKQYHFSQITKKVDWLKIEDCNFETAYSKLKLEKEFEWFEDNI